MEWFLQHVWGVSIACVGILLMLYFWFCANKIFNLSRDIKKISKDSDFISALKESSLLKPAWKNFEKTLTKINNEIYSTTDASEFFNTQNLTRGMNMSFWQAYGGIFTGLGILGTFACLTSGLSSIDITSGNIDDLKNGIEQLLSGVGAAFVTSLVGIGAALLYSVAHHLLLKNFQSNVKALTERIDEKFPYRSIEDWLAANHDESQNQTTELKNIDTGISDQKVILQNIGEDVARAIYEGLDERINAAMKNLCDRLEEKIIPQTDKICAAIDSLGTSGNDRLGEIISDRVGSQMDRFSSALDKFSDSIEEKLKTANEISKIMNEQLLNTLKELNESLKQNAKTSAEERDAEHKKFSGTLESLIDTLNELAGKIKIQQENTAKDFETLVKNALDNFNAVMAQTTANVQSKFNETNKQYNAASEQFLTTLAGLGKTLQEVAENFKLQQKTSADNFDSLIKNLIDNLEKFTDEQKKILNNAATSNIVQISEAVKSFRNIVDRHNEATQKTFTQIQKQLIETEEFLQQVNSAGTSLRQAVEPVKQSTQQLTNNLIETSVQIKTLSAANQTTRENLSDLTDKLRTFVNNFNDIADELEKSTNIIKDSLEHYNYEMSKGLSEALTKFDSTVSKSALQLNDVMEEINSALEDLKQIRNRR